MNNILTFLNSKMICSNSEICLIKQLEEITDHKNSLNKSHSIFISLLLKNYLEKLHNRTFKRKNKWKLDTPQSNLNYNLVGRIGIKKNKSSKNIFKDLKRKKHNY